MADWRDLLRLADSNVPKFRKAFLTAVQQANAAVDTAALKTLLAQRNYSQAATMLEQAWGTAAPGWQTALVKDTLDTVGGSGVSAETRIKLEAQRSKLTSPAGVSSWRFDMLNPRAIQWAQNQSAALVVNVNQQQLTALRDIVGRSTQGALTKDAAARVIRDDVLVGMGLGLDPRRAAALANFTERMQASVTKMAAGGATPKALAKATQRSANAIARYQRKLLNSRADTIARTETIAAACQGQVEAWKQAMDRGLLPRTVEKVWIVTPDDRLCRKTCKPMQGQRRAIDAPFDAPGVGMVQHPPAHPNCRCAIGLKPAKQKKSLVSKTFIPPQPALVRPAGGLTPMKQFSMGGLESYGEQTGLYGEMQQGLGMPQAEYWSGSYKTVPGKPGYVAQGPYSSKHSAFGAKYKQNLTNATPVKIPGTDQWELHIPLAEQSEAAQASMQASLAANQPPSLQAAVQQTVPKTVQVPTNQSVIAPNPAAAPAPTIVPSAQHYLDDFAKYADKADADALHQQVIGLTTAEQEAVTDIVVDLHSPTNFSTVVDVVAQAKQAPGGAPVMLENLSGLTKAHRDEDLALWQKVFPDAKIAHDADSGALIIRSGPTKVEKDFAQLLTQVQTKAENLAWPIPDVVTQAQALTEPEMADVLAKMAGAPNDSTITKFISAIDEVKNPPPPPSEWDALVAKVDAKVQQMHYSQGAQQLQDYNAFKGKTLTDAQKAQVVAKLQGHPQSGLISDFLTAVDDAEAAVPVQAQAVPQVAAAVGGPTAPAGKVWKGPYKNKHTANGFKYKNKLVDAKPVQDPVSGQWFLETDAPGAQAAAVQAATPQGDIYSIWTSQSAAQDDAMLGQQAKGTIHIVKKDPLSNHWEVWDTKQPVPQAAPPPHALFSSLPEQMAKDLAAQQESLSGIKHTAQLNPATGKWDVLNHHVPVPAPTPPAAAVPKVKAAKPLKPTMKGPIALHPGDPIDIKALEQMMGEPVGKIDVGGGKYLLKGDHSGLKVSVGGKKFYVDANNQVHSVIGKVKQAFAQNYATFSKMPVAQPAAAVVAPPAAAPLSSVAAAQTVVPPPVASTAATIARTPPKPAAWFDSLLKDKLSDAKGTNPGGLFRDSEGHKWYVKLYNDPDQGVGEALANTIYRDLGLEAPESVIGTTSTGQRVFASRWMDDVVNTFENIPVTPEAANEFANGFIADVLTGNWDAVGAGSEHPLGNIALLRSGKVARVDQGGTFLFRGLTGKKPTDVLKKITEWEKFFTSNPRYAQVMEKAGIHTAEDLAQRAVKQIDDALKLVTDPTQRAQWMHYVEQAIPNATRQMQADLADMLHARAKLLAEKRDELKALLQPVQQVARAPVSVGDMYTFTDAAKEVAMRPNAGAYVPYDGGDIEMLQLRSRGVEIGGEEWTEFKFKLTDAAGTRATQLLPREAGFKRSAFKLPTQRARGNGVRSVLDETIDSGITQNYGSYGETLTIEQPGVKIRLLRMTDQRYGPTAYHNQVQIFIRGTPDEAAVQKVLKQLGVQAAHTPTQAEVDAFAENAFVRLFQTGVGDLNTTQRARVIAEAKTKYGVSPRDLEFVPGRFGRPELRFTDEAHRRLMQKIGDVHFTHNLADQSVDGIVDMLSGEHDGLLSTTIRFSEGIAKNGMSSSADVGTGGADGFFFHQRRGAFSGHGTSGQVVFDNRLLKRTDWWSYQSDTYGCTNPLNGDYGSRVRTRNNLTAVQSSDGETMFRHRVGFEDAEGLFLDPRTRASVIAKLRARGITQIGGRPVEQFIKVGS